MSHIDWIVTKCVNEYERGSRVNRSLLYLAAIRFEGDADGN